jgi:hypothetical protein
MNSAHNGHRLGTALFKVCDQLGIAHKIEWVTCDNASNNAVMMTHFAAMIQQATGKELDAKKRRIRCVLSFVILSLVPRLTYLKGVLRTSSTLRRRQ